MVSTTPSPPLVVVDASMAIALCAKEADKLVNAEARIKEYAIKGAKFFAPGVIVAECLYVFCRKLQDGVLTTAQHASAIQAFIALMTAIQPPPTGDKCLIRRAEEIRGTLGCSRSADGIYLALAEELAKSSVAEIVTFDNGMRTQATLGALSPHVEVVPTT
jgi:predicted nucleic acid-binding protein